MKALFDYRVVGMLRIKNEERWIARVIESIVPVCSAIVIFDDHSADGTIDILSEYDVAVIESPFSTFDEARDKDYILKVTCDLYQPDFILAIDGDEALEREGATKIAKWLGSYGESQIVSTYSFKIRYLWNTETQIRVDGVYQNFTRPSMFRIKGEPQEKLAYTKTDPRHNLHCSSFPQGLSGGVVPTDIQLKHFGYMLPEDRQRKYKWYNMIDPDNNAEDGYRHIIELPSRHAPGPSRFEEWVD